MSSYIKFLSRNELYTAIEFLGLSVALAFVVIAFCYVVQQYSVTRENPDRERVYAIGPHDVYGSITNSYAMKETIDGKLPEIESVSHCHVHEKTQFRHGEQKLNGTLLNCDRELFEMFHTEFKEGDAERMTESKVAFVSEKFANKLDGEVVGSQIIIGMDTLDIVGVVTDLGTSLLPDCDVFGHIALSNKDKAYKQNKFTWFSNMPTFIKVRPNTDREALAEKLEDLYEESHGGRRKIALIRLDEVYFSGISMGLRLGDKSMLRTMIIVGLLLLISALINYINLNVALIGKRAKEMASRRLLGAQKSEIVWKFLGEAFAFTLFSFAVGLAIASAIIPGINRLLAAAVAVKIPFTASYLIAYMLIVIVVSLLAGFMPAAIISKTRPIDVVKGTFQYHSKKTLSRIFIVLQNIIVIILIAIVLTMELQMRHMVNRPIGLNVENLYFIESDMDRSNIKMPFVEDLRALPCVKEIASADNIPGMGNRIMIYKKSGSEKRDTKIYFLNGDSTAFRMFGFEVKKKFLDAEGDRYMTESAFATLTGTQYGENDFNALLAWQAENRDLGICGVIKDFNMLDALHATDEDLSIVSCNGGFNEFSGVLLEITGNHKDAKRAIDEVLRKHLEKVYCEYLEPDCNDFVVNVIAKKYDKTHRQMRLIEIIWAVSVMLALLGLVAMSTHFASEREKGIAIRKVFGGTMESEIRRNLKEYIVMILIANVIAIPVAIWLCGRYLEDFAYRIPTYWWIFAAAAVLSFVIAIGSVIWQIVSVSKVNPAYALKKE